MTIDAYTCALMALHGRQHRLLDRDDLGAAIARVAADQGLASAASAAQLAPLIEQLVAERLLLASQGRYLLTRSGSERAEHAWRSASAAAAASGPAGTTPQERAIANPPAPPTAGPRVAPAPLAGLVPRTALASALQALSAR